MKPILISPVAPFRPAALVRLLRTATLLSVLAAGTAFTAAGLLGQDRSQAMSEVLRSRMEIYRSGGRLVVGETDLAASDVIADLYQLTRFEPQWTSESNRRDLLAAIRAAPDQGLMTSDYHLAEIEALGLESGIPDDPTAGADADLLLTDAMVRLAFHVRFGKVNPRALDADWNFERELRDQAPEAILHEALQAGQVGELLAGLEPQRPYYSRLKDALALYREIAGRGGWDPIDAGPTLRMDMEDTRVAQVRRRLQATGDLTRDPARATSGPEAERFDQELEDAVRAYQERNGLDVDGAVGRGTLGMMNVTVEERIDQVRINLERARWVMNDVGADFVAANIAGFEVLIVRNDEIVWRTRAQVGKEYRKTPIFQADLSYTVFNPTWTVPPTILAQDVLPAIRADAGYLDAKHMDVLDHGGGVIDPATVDWDRYANGGFPYIIRQRPGPWNALGQAKFIFPNPHFVFMHDTPSRGLFDREVRTFSSGCIRVEDPVEFSVQVLNDPNRWDRAAVEAAIESQKTQTVYLDDPLPVLLLYWTAEPDEDGRVHFARDIYDRDGPVLRELNEPFAGRLTMPGGGQG